MPDFTIAMQGKPTVELMDPMRVMQQGNAMAMQRMQMQEAMADRQQRNAMAQMAQTLDVNDPRQIQQFMAQGGEPAAQFVQNMQGASKARQQQMDADQERNAKLLGRVFHGVMANPTDDALNGAAMELVQAGADPDQVAGTVTRLRGVPLEQRPQAMLSLIAADPASMEVYKMTAPKPQQMNLGTSVVIIDMNPLSHTFQKKMSEHAAQRAMKIVQGEDGYAAVDTYTGTAKPVTMGGGASAAPGAFGAAIESAALAAVPGAQVTSRARSPSHNKEVGGVPNSYHLSDNARDFVPPKGVSMGQLASTLTQTLGPKGFQVINEGDHVHVEPAKRAAGGGVLRPPAKEGAAGASAKQTVAEQNAAYNAGRVLDAATAIQNAAANNPDAEAPGMAEAVVGGLPLVNGFVNFTRSGDRQIVNAAQRDMVDALLYLSTGAAYNKEQFTGQVDSYLPQYSDKPEARASKRQRLRNLIQKARIRAGNAWTPQMDAAMENLLAGDKTAAKPKPKAAAPKAKSTLPPDVAKLYGL